MKKYIKMIGSLRSVRKKKGFILALLISIILVWWFVFRKKTKTPEDNQNSQNQATEEETDKSKIRFSESVLRGIATAVFNAMARLGTDEETIKNSLMKLNGDELRMVTVYFGTPRYFAGDRAAFLGEELTLQGWLSSELGSEDYYILKSYYDSQNYFYL